jgi:lysozyme family protein
MIKDISRFTPELKAEYLLNFDATVYTPIGKVYADNAINYMSANHTRYEDVANRTGVPAWWIGIIHKLECNGDFNKHLHNGDPLTARTVHVPAGRPLLGMPPFSWEFSAIDSLMNVTHLDQWHDWSIAGALYRMELYNGTGYRYKGLWTPYLWSLSNHYIKGKYVADGQFAPDAVSQAIGGAVILKRLVERGFVKE